LTIFNERKRSYCMRIDYFK